MGTKYFEIWFLSMWNIYLQEATIKISLRFSVKTYDKLKMIEMMVNIHIHIMI